MCGGASVCCCDSPAVFNKPVMQSLLFLVQNLSFLLFVKSVYYSETTLGACVEI